MPWKILQMFHQKKQRPKARFRKCLIQFEVSESLVKNDIYVDTKLFLEANERKEKGQTDFAAFVLFRSNKHLPDLIENAWKIHNAKASIKCEKTTRMEILMKASLRAVLMVVRWSGMNMLCKCSS